MMYLKRKMRRSISAALAAAMTVGNVLAVPAAPTGEGMYYPLLYNKLFSDISVKIKRVSA